MRKAIRVGFPKPLGVVGTISRFKPLHRGHAALLEALCKHATFVKIGIGSSNEYNVRNPFTPAESDRMIHALLRGRYANYQVIAVPDLHHGKRWTALALRLFGSLDAFITTNGYVRRLLSKHYRIIDSHRLLGVGKWDALHATSVREKMAAGEPWEHLCPAAVVQYLKRAGLVKRFVGEFGRATLAKKARVKRRAIGR